MPYGRKSRIQYGRKTKGSKRGPKIPRRARAPVKIEVDLEEGELRKHGYRMGSQESTRHMALGKAVHEDGGLTVFHRLQLLIQYNKNKNPALAGIATKDRDWLKKRYYRTNHWD